MASRVVLIAAVCILLLFANADAQASRSLVRGKEWLLKQVLHKRGGAR